MDSFTLCILTSDFFLLSSKFLRFIHGIWSCDLFIFLALCIPFRNTTHFIYPFYCWSIFKYYGFFKVVIPGDVSFSIVWFCKYFHSVEDMFIKHTYSLVWSEKYTINSYVIISGIINTKVFFLSLFIARIHSHFSHYWFILFNWALKKLGK
jgi:hypothetical protein